MKAIQLSSPWNASANIASEGLSYDDIVKKVRKTDIFTTHTPVPAGNDQFPIWMIDKYFPVFWEGLNLTRDQFINLGKQSQSWGDMFSMPVLALHLSEHCQWGFRAARRGGPQDVEFPVARPQCG